MPDSDTKTNLSDLKGKKSHYLEETLTQQRERCAKEHLRMTRRMEDTVEKNVDGLAEQIIVEDEQRKAEDLVSILH